MRALVVGSLCALSLVASPSLAADETPTKQQCAAAYVSAQRLRKAEKLGEAKAQLEICAHNACPPALANDCKSWRDEVTASLPSVLISVIGLDGSATDGARVQIDGRPVAARSNEPIELEPGTHTFHFELDGASPMEKVVELSKGSKAVPVAADFSSEGAKRATPDSAAPPEPDSAKNRRPVPPAVLVLGGVGVLGLGSFVYFGSKGKSEENHLADTCAPHCSRSDVDASHKKLMIADISLGVSVAAFAGAAYFYFTRPTKERVPSVAFVPAPGGGAAFVRGTF